jgi:hypothetical protein
MTCQTIANTDTALRSLYGVSGYLAIINLYSKTRHNTGSDKLLARFPAPEVMRLLLYYLALIRPLEITFAAELYGQQASTDYSTYLWMQRGKLMDSHACTDVLRYFTDLFLHVPLGCADWRQLTKNVFRYDFPNYVHTTLLTDLSL